MDIKYILGYNFMYEFYQIDYIVVIFFEFVLLFFIQVKEGIYIIGYQGEGFFWDNEQGVYKIYLYDFVIVNWLIINGEYMVFMADGGYE